MGKTFSMTCRPCPGSGNQLEEAYGQKMMGEGPTYRERQKERVECRDCGKEMAAGLLASHRITHHEKSKAEEWSWNKSAKGGGEKKPIG